jgi:hypothetical protein
MSRSHSSNGQSLLDRSRIEIKLGRYGTAPAAALADPLLLARVQDYRRQSAGRMVPLDQKGLREKVPASAYHVSRKIDGEFSVLVYRDGEALTLNPGGTVRVGLPWQDEAARLLKQAGVQETLIAGELYVHKDDGSRSRVHDVITVSRQPQSEADLSRLRFAAFDLISLNGEGPPDSYAGVWERVVHLFGQGERVHPVETQPAGDALEIERLFAKWALDEGAEGLVARSDTAGLFKVKPRHTIDAAVIGFTESLDERRGLLHDLLLAVMRDDGTLHVLCRVGGGFSEDQRRELLSDLKDRAAGSEYAEVNSDHVAYQMVRPEWVVEISCLDLVAETTRGGPIARMVLDWDAGARTYRVVRRMPLVSVISPQFVRLRDDKAVRPADVRIGQLTGLVEVPQADRDARRLTLPPSEVLRREVFTKEYRGETMVRKFVLWKTNKEAEGDWPAYVVHYTDFSPGRKDPLAREVRVSNSEQQIHALWDQLQEENVKKGWSLHSSITSTASAATQAVEEVKKPAKKSAKKAADVPAAQPKAPAKKKAVTKKASDTKAAEKPAKKKPITKKPAAAKKKAAPVTELAPSERSRSKSAGTKKKSG